VSPLIGAGASASAQLSPGGAPTNSTQPMRIAAGSGSTVRLAHAAAHSWTASAPFAPTAADMPWTPWAQQRVQRAALVGMAGQQPAALQPHPALATPVRRPHPEHARTAAYVQNAGTPALRLPPAWPAGIRLCAPLSSVPSEPAAVLQAATAAAKGPQQTVAGPCTCAKLPASPPLASAPSPTAGMTTPKRRRAPRRCSSCLASEVRYVSRWRPLFQHKG
jgi:hypothetical protein